MALRTQERSAHPRGEREGPERAPGLGYDELNRLAVACDPGADRAPAGASGRRRGHRRNPVRLPELAALDPAAHGQHPASISLEMLDRVAAMLAAAAEPIRTFVLTRGLSRATLVREVVHMGLRQLAERDPRVGGDTRILLNDRSAAAATPGGERRARV